MTKKKNGRSQLLGHAGEANAIAELGRRGWTASNFKANIADYDILAASGREIRRIQVKTIAAGRGGNFQSNLCKWFEYEICHDSKKQTLLRRLPVPEDQEDIIWLFIWMHPKNYHEDRFFLMSYQDVSDLVCSLYEEWLEGYNFKRPKKYDSTHCGFRLTQIPEEFEDNWEILKPSAPP